jgi:hypothetical protein
VLAGSLLADTGVRAGDQDGSPRMLTCPLLKCRIAAFAVTGTPPPNGPSN